MSIKSINESINNSYKATLSEAVRISDEKMENPAPIIGLKAFLDNSRKENDMFYATVEKIENGYLVSSSSNNELKRDTYYCENVEAIKDIIDYLINVKPIIISKPSGDIKNV